MEITEVFYPQSRAEWRTWLARHHQTKSEVWLRTFRKATGKPSLAYEEMVLEALCFGWIDGSVKKYDAESSVRRITPRRKKTSLSELNRQRIWKLQAQGLMTPAGFAPIEAQIGSPDDAFEIPDWILQQLQADETVWKNFQQFPPHYQRLKVGWVAEVKGLSRRAEAQKRLDYLVKMTRLGKVYGSVV
ncbi:MAG: YdeI/OmpD-associated family protein [Saprospiraceae bacterium]